jgi:hypothetical protein
MSDTSLATTAKPPKTVSVVFNRIAIELPKGKQDGASIKAAAIEQGVNIQPSYVLFLIKDNGNRKLIGDADDVNVHEGDRYAAVADDDNS